MTALGSESKGDAKSVSGSQTAVEKFKQYQAYIETHKESPILTAQFAGKAIVAIYPQIPQEARTPEIQLLLAFYYLTQAAGLRLDNKVQESNAAFYSAQQILDDDNLTKNCDKNLQVRQLELQTVAAEFLRGKLAVRIGKLTNLVEFNPLIATFNAKFTKALEAYKEVMNDKNLNKPAEVIELFEGEQGVINYFRKLGKPTQKEYFNLAACYVAIGKLKQRQDITKTSNEIYQHFITARDLLLNERFLPERNSEVLREIFYVEYELARDRVGQYADKEALTFTRSALAKAQAMEFELEYADIETVGRLAAFEDLLINRLKAKETKVVRMLPQRASKTSVLGKLAETKKSIVELKQEHRTTFVVSGEPEVMLDKLWSDFKKDTKDAGKFVDILNLQAAQEKLKNPELTFKGNLVNAIVDYFINTLNIIYSKKAKTFKLNVSGDIKSLSLENFKKLLVNIVKLAAQQLKPKILIIKMGEIIAAEFGKDKRFESKGDGSELAELKYQCEVLTKEIKGYTFTIPTVINQNIQKIESPTSVLCKEAKEIRDSVVQSRNHLKTFADKLMANIKRRTEIAMGADALKTLRHIKRQYAYFVRARDFLVEKSQISLENIIELNKKSAEKLLAQAALSKKIAKTSQLRPQPKKPFVPSQKSKAEVAKVEDKLPTLVETVTALVAATEAPAETELKPDDSVVKDEAEGASELLEAVELDSSENSAFQSEPIYQPLFQPAAPPSAAIDPDLAAFLKAVTAAGGDISVFKPG